MNVDVTTADKMSTVVASSDITPPDMPSWCQFRCQKCRFKLTPYTTYVTMKRAFMANWISILKIFWTSYSNTIRPTGGAFEGGKYHRCDRNLHTCQNSNNGKKTVCADISRKMLKALNREVLLWQIVYVKLPGVLEGHQQSKSLSDHPYTQDGRQDWML